MTSHPLESLIRRTANRCGIDVTRYRPENSDCGRLVTMLKHHDVDLVLDVGANVGQFAIGLRRAGYTGRILSFEPLSAAHHKLCIGARNDSQWDIAPRMAIGDEEGKVEFHVAGNSVSSSVLEMLESHASSAPASRYVGTESVQISRLDRAAGPAMAADTVSFLKIDTQGYEGKVLDGAPNVLSKVKGLQLELSFVPLYEGQHLIDALLQRLTAMGFSVWAFWPGFCDPTTGRMLQVDAVLFRE